ncbi:MFS transporter [Glutamicibacter nicotianae]
MSYQDVTAAGIIYFNARPNRTAERIDSLEIHQPVAFSLLLNRTDKAVLGLAAQPLSAEFGLTTAQIGLMGSAFYLAFAISGFFAGFLQKKMSIKWTLTFLVSAWAVAMVTPMLAIGGFSAVLPHASFLA